MMRLLAAAACIALVMEGCASGIPTSSEPPEASVAPASSASLGAAVPSAIATPASLPDGRVLFHRVGSDGVERYFTIKTDGTDETAVYEREGCSCAHLSADGKRILTIGETGHGTYSLLTMNLDGTDHVTTEPPLSTLNLFIGATSSDGRVLALEGVDETSPTNTGLWVASPTLADLRFVTPRPNGTVSAESFGVTPDGSHILFFADRGRTEHPEGDLYVVGADGTGLRQLNPPGTTHNFLEVRAGSLSPDGRRATFGVEGRVYVVDVDGGEAQPITDPADFVWAVSWSPTGEWITYTRQHDSTSVVSLIRPNGTDQHEISANDASDEAENGVWSPDGQYLLVQRGTDGQRDLWIMDLEGNYVSQVTHEPSNYGSWAWAPVSGS